MLFSGTTSYLKTSTKSYCAYWENVKNGAKHSMLDIVAIGHFHAQIGLAVRQSLVGHGDIGGEILLILRSKILFIRFLSNKTQRFDFLV